MADHYFSFYEIQPCFFPDTGYIKRKYFEFSKIYHPDFYSDADEKKQEEVLELSSINNKAYTTLSDYDKRLFYVLSLYFDMEAEGKKAMDPDFLMEMMDFNEKLQDAQMENDAIQISQLVGEANELQKALDDDILPLMKTFDEGDHSNEILEKIKEYYFKRKYFLRIQENISTFAGL
jgi:molecular chaperone HscB